jgi:hypothetical protein
MLVAQSSKPKMTRREVGATLELVLDRLLTP